MSLEPQTLAAITSIVGALAWPVTTLVLVLLFRGTISSWLRLPKSFDQRSLKAKAGGFEIELTAFERLEEKLQAKALQIAEEPDYKKRLELAKNLQAIETLLSEISNSDVDILASLRKSSIPGATLFSFWDRSDPKRLEIYNRLQKLGLVAFVNGYESEGVMIITNLGDALLKRLSTTTD